MSDGKTFLPSFIRLLLTDSFNSHSPSEKKKIIDLTQAMSRD